MCVAEWLFCIHVFIDRLTSEDLQPENYKDEYRIRVLAMLDEKSKGKEITISAPAPQRGGKSRRHHGSAKAEYGESPRQKETHNDRDQKEKECVVNVFFLSDTIS